MSTSAPQSPRGARAAEKQKRRANSCLPCRESKSRCTGGIPCDTCQKKRQKPRCVYRNMPERGDPENVIPEEDGDSTSQQDASMDDEDDTSDDSSIIGPHESFFGTFSLARVVAEVKQLSPSSGRARDIIDQIDTVKAFQVISSEAAEGVSTASPGDQRPLLSTMPDSQLPKALRRLHSRYLSVKKLLDSGMATQAWTTFPSLVRDAEVIGLDQDDGANERAVDKANTQGEARRRMWRLLIDLDIGLSFILGRAPSLSHNANDPKLSLGALHVDEKDLIKSKREFIRHKASMLSWIYSEKLLPENISDEQKGRFEGLLEDLESVQRDLPPLSHTGPAELIQSLSVAKYHLEVHLFALVANGFMARCIASEQAQLATSRQKAAQSHSKTGKVRPTRKQAPSKYYKEMLQSARRVMELFHFIHTSDSSKSGLSWTRCFGAYSAASVLGIARLRQEVELEADSSRIEKTLELFRDLATASPDLSIAQLGATSLENMLDGLRTFEQHLKDTESAPDMPAPPVPQQTQLDTSPAKVKQELAPYTTKFRKHPKKRPSSSVFEEDKSSTEKRARFTEVNPSFEAQMPPDVQAWPMHQEAQYGQPISSFRDMPTHSFDGTAPVSFEHVSYPGSAATSFASNMDPSEYTPLRYIPPQGVPDIPWPTNRRDHPEVPWPTPALISPPLYHNGWENHINTLEPEEVVADHFFRNPDPPPQAVYQMLSDDQPHPDQGFRNFYPPTVETYPVADHIRSSPLMNELSSQQQQQQHQLHDQGFSQSGLSGRRQSAAELEIKGSWTMDTSANYGDVANDQPRVIGTRVRTPPRDNLVSPISDSGMPQSRRNSATARQIAQQGLGNPGDFSTMQTQMHSSQGQMMVPLQGVQDMGNQEYPGSRRQSLAHVAEGAMGDMGMASSSGSTWHGQASSTGRNPYENTSGPTQYEIDINNHNAAVAFTHQIQQQQQQQQRRHAPHHQIHHHPHEYPGQHAPPPNPTITTAPYTANHQGWWSR